ncbi:MAG: hypothetical protein ACRBEE_12370 [Arenicella sp.]
MEKIKVKFENCFGIGKLNYSFDFSDSNSFLIYAPNGMMKTSFAKTFQLFGKNDPKDQPRDKVHECATVCEISDEAGNEISRESILVVNLEDQGLDTSDKISKFIASRDLKKRYDTIYKELNEKKSLFIRQLKKISRSNDCEVEFINTFKKEEKDNFFEILYSIKNDLVDDPKKCDFRYNDVFDKKGNVKKFLDKNEAFLDDYIEQYKVLLSESSFFKGSDNSFGTYEAGQIDKSTGDNSFFEAGHRFVLGDGFSITSSKGFKEIITTEIEKVLDDEDLKKAFDKFDKAIGSNAELRSFKEAIGSNESLLIELKHYEKFKEKVWISYFSELKKEVVELCDFYKLQEKDLKSIIKESKKEFDVWKEIIIKFNTRFYVPFKVILSNQEDIILKEETAKLDFLYDDDSGAGVEKDRDSLLDILSKGEQRAYYILQLLFDIEARKSNIYKNLIIFDDIADSFDYKNKYAVIEYIREINISDKFNMIILTHNFDFYRTVASRLNLPKMSVLMSTKNEYRTVTLEKGKYKKDVFSDFLSAVEQPAIFISLITFVRNLIEYSGDKASADYMLLTSCLHIKDGTQDIIVKDVFDAYKTKLPNKFNQIEISFEGEKIIPYIYKIADEIASDPRVNEMKLENKIVLSIAIRLKAEEFMIASLPELDLSQIEANQTRELLDEYPQNDNKEVLDKVNLMTPEHIHLNAFMYEPLIDMSVNHLIGLYREVESLSE